MSKSMVQIKFTIESDIVSAFKARCASKDVSMASVISQFMKTGQSAKDTNIKIDTRAHRKKTVSEYIGFLKNLIYMEEQYRDAIPEQFESRFETANYTCDQLELAVSYLEDAY